MNSFKIGKSTIGPGAPLLFFPDIDVYFNKDIEAAKSLISQLCDAGVNIIKSAVLHRLDMTLPDNVPQGYMTRKGVVKEGYRTILERKIIPLGQFAKIFDAVKSSGCDLVLSVYDEEGADFSKEIGACALKIPSSNVVHEKLVQYVAQLGLPMILDTGKSTFEEIARAVQWAEDAGAKEMVIQHSPAAPPAPLSEHHLRMMLTLKEMFGYPVGLSDHHSGEEMLYAAVALGASVVEKAIITDDQEEDIDVYHALEISRVKEVWEKCQNIHEALGNGRRCLPRDREKPNGWMGLISRKDLNPGDFVEERTIGFAFPALGIGAEYWSRVKGTKLKRPIKAGSIIRWSDIEFIDP